MFWKIIAGVAIGGGLGFTLGYFGKCASGVCPLRSNPYVSTIVGALIGLMLTVNR